MKFLSALRVSEFTINVLQMACKGKLAYRFLLRHPYRVGALFLRVLPAHQPPRHLLILVKRLGGRLCSKMPSQPRRERRIFQ